ncbi:MAG: SRPBCC family protein [Gordonia sp. (in: high G+C Gram-positive bacteria)]|uniref:SRPBCC family protein n=1 Tax=Gordonia sp. (in: high G+C Gram-positive bacteria) TaxID=84139 RepID=UPI0039E6C5AC
MAGFEITVTREIAAPVEVIWSVLTDLDAAPTTLTGVTAVERVSGDGYGVGTRWRETRLVLKREAVEEMWVDEIDPPRRTVIRSQNHGTL